MVRLWQSHSPVFLKCGWNGCFSIWAPLYFCLGVKTAQFIWFWWLESAQLAAQVSSGQESESQFSQSWVRIPLRRNAGDGMQTWWLVQRGLQVPWRSWLWQICTESLESSDSRPRSPQLSVKGVSRDWMGPQPGLCCFWIPNPDKGPFSYIFTFESFHCFLWSEVKENWVRS